MARNIPSSRSYNTSKEVIRTHVKFVAQTQKSSRTPHQMMRLYKNHNGHERKSNARILNISLMEEKTSNLLQDAHVKP